MRQKKNQDFSPDMWATIWWQRADLNRRPKAYESSALPLSYTAGNVIFEMAPEVGFEPTT